MPKKIDTRDFTYSPQANNFAAAELLSDALPGEQRVIPDRVNNFTGSTDNLRSVNPPAQFLGGAEASPSDAALIGKALEYIKSVAPALGFASTQQPEFVPDPHVKTTSTGTRIVNLQQQYRGIPVFHMERSVWFEKTGEISNVAGANVELPPDLETLPVVSLEKAVKVAAEYVASPSDRVDSWTKKPVPAIEIDVAGYQPRILGRTMTPAQSSVVSRGPFAEDIPAHLVFFYQGPTTRLGWRMVLTTPNFEEQYVVIVEADSKVSGEPQILYGQKTSSEMAARGSVWLHNPGVNATRTVVDFPMPLADYPIPTGSLNLADPSFPRAWVDDGGQATIGNCTVAVSGFTTNSVNGNSNGGILSFDFAQDQGNDQKVVNIFFFCNYMHDFFYMLGFDEEHGNFQKVNFTGLGTGGDAVLARAHPGAVNGTANMVTRADGIGALMNMGLVTSAGRHTAFDSDVVFHEFTHGVTKRLVGGRLDALALEDPQSQGMGEGWSDYFALTIQHCRALIQDSAAPEKTVSGDWVLDDARGVRSAPYDDNYPNTFGDLGTPPFNEEHFIGEIWCAALMKMNRDFGAALGDRVRAHQLGWQIVVDGLKLTPINPSMLDARDAILKALEDRNRAGLLSQGDFEATKRAAWRAFARFGMGPNARSIGASLQGIVEDRNPPPGM
ncbi:MAG TPA: M36 family metallopeptidase [Pyrinomonadaceae bacterium]|nr:M36 family metallopeptidase [Pyrinomonadaceae bacterium]